MATCPDCGSIVMKGDPYCSHCGAHLIWSDDETFERSNSKFEEIIMNDIIASRKQKINLVNKIFELVKTKDTRLDRVDIDIDNARFIFKRENRYLTTTVSCLFRFLSDDSNIFESYEINSDYSNIVNDSRFQNSLRAIENKIGKSFSHVSGGYEVRQSPFGDITFLDEYNVSVFFKNSHGGGFEQYLLDLNTMELTSMMDSLFDELKRVGRRGL